MHRCLISLFGWIHAFIGKLSCTQVDYLCSLEILWIYNKGFIFLFCWSVKLCSRQIKCLSIFKDPTEAICPAYWNPPLGLLWCWVTNQRVGASILLSIVLSTYFTSPLGAFAISLIACANEHFFQNLIWNRISWEDRIETKVEGKIQKNKLLENI